MLDSQAVPQERTVEVLPRKIELGLSEDGSRNRISVLLPSVEELIEIRDLAQGHVSVTQIAANAGSLFEELFSDALSRMQERFSKSGDSSTYLNRLANLSELSGNLEAAQKYIEAAHQRDPSPFFTVKLGVNLLKQNRLEAATKVLSGESLKDDLYGNLALAYVEIADRRYGDARQRVSKILQSDPSNFMGRLLAGVVNVVLSQFQQAIRDFRVALDERPGSSIVLTNLAVAYVCVGETSKALKTLRASVKINPLNKNAVALLADLCHSSKVDCSAVPALQIYLRYEQKSAAMWSRLARALFLEKKVDDAIAALRNQASVAQNAAVWSNLGVAFLEKGDVFRAEQYYRYAITQFGEKDDQKWQIAASNLISLFVQQERYKEAVELSGNVIQNDSTSRLLKNDLLGGVYLNNLTALACLHRHDEFLVMTRSLLEREGSLTLRLKMGLYSNLIHYFSLWAPNLECAVKFARDGLSLPGVPKTDSALGRVQLLLRNNAAFALIEAGLTDEAEPVLSKLSAWVHKEPLPTATLALFNLAKGHGPRGMELYRESIRMLGPGRTRDQFAQKMNLEIGKYYCRLGHPAKARLYFGRAVAIKGRIPSMAEDAKRLLRTLPLKT